MSVAIVMPAYNESACIEKVVDAWLEPLALLDGSLIVINDGSKDATGEILDGLAARHPRLKVIHQVNAGHGAAVIRGYREALQSGATHVFQTDSDDQFQPKDFWHLWGKRADSPFILGRRKDRHDAVHRKVISKIVLILAFLLFGAQLKDANVPFRLIRADFLREILPLIPDGVFAPNIFLTIIAAKLGCRLFEVPITHEARKTGQVSILRYRLVKACLISCRDLFQFRISLITKRKTLNSLSETYV